MGVVYQAHDPVIGRDVAIKLVRADLLEGEEREQFLALFLREAQAAGRCAHPNIVALYDFAVHEGNPFLAMEYVNGIGLSEALKQAGRFTPGEAVAITAQLLDALSAAHALGIVHRDVKPANILLTPERQVKVTDFGISRLNTSEFTLAGRIVGTPAYMSPEQALGESVDFRSDLFSAGSLLYELLSGSRPFPGPNVSSISYHLVNSEPMDLTRTVPGVPSGLVAVVRKAMEKSREARFSSAQEMATALRESVSDSAPVRSGSVTNETGLLAEQVERAERALTRALGPIAKVLVKRALPGVGSETALWQRLSTHIEDSLERDRFLVASRTGSLKDVSGSTKSLPTTGAGTAEIQDSLSGEPEDPNQTTPFPRLSAAQIERAERALTRHLGPIARLLVKRIASETHSEAVLWDRLARHIENPGDRDLFLRQRPED